MGEEAGRDERVGLGDGLIVPGSGEGDEATYGERIGEGIGERDSIAIASVFVEECWVNGEGI